MFRSLGCSDFRGGLVDGTAALEQPVSTFQILLRSARKRGATGRLGEPQTRAESPYGPLRGTGTENFGMRCSRRSWAAARLPMNRDGRLDSAAAQRESAQAYIASQRHEGWVCLPSGYDDGGCSGGSIQRPALQQLLADIEAGTVDCVVVYKVDRLSRSLLDFARIIERFQRHGVSLVSVTQQFNTTSSMGRLTLNVLLSFAQFEREIISERTRDKMAAARRKGRRLGGVPVLGYDVQPTDKQLVVNTEEAERVRAMYELYLQHRGLVPVLRQIQRRRWRTKRWVTKKGIELGGSPFTKSGLHRLLRNVTYTGKVSYKGALYEGPLPLHPIGDCKLSAHHSSGKKAHDTASSLLVPRPRAPPSPCAGPKTDQEGDGAVLFLGAPTLAQLDAWLVAADVVTGDIDAPLFQRIDRGDTPRGPRGQITARSLRPPVSCPRRSGPLPRQLRALDTRTRNSVAVKSDPEVRSSSCAARSSPPAGRSATSR